LFYAGDFERSLKYAREAAKVAPVNGDFLAMASASLDRTDEAAQATKALLEMDPQWSAERLLTNFGSLSGDVELARLTTGARKAGLRLCLSKEELTSLPTAIHIKDCDEQRAKG
jgi:hypothetical protein